MHKGKCGSRDTISSLLSIWYYPKKELNFITDSCLESERFRFDIFTTHKKDGSNKMKSGKLILLTKKALKWCRSKILLISRNLKFIWHPHP